MKLHKQSHSVYKTQYHIVWVTRYRRKILKKGLRSDLENRLREVRKFHPDLYFEAIGIDKDHLHLQMVIPPRYRVSDVIGMLKKNTSRHLREKYAYFLKKVYWDGGGIWSKGYFVSTVGINEQVIQRYVRYQGQEDAEQAQLEW